MTFDFENAGSVTLQVPIDAGPDVEREVSAKSGPAEHGEAEGSEAEPMNPGEGGNPDTETGWRSVTWAVATLVKPPPPSSSLLRGPLTSDFDRVGSPRSRGDASRGTPERPGFSHWCVPRAEGVGGAS